MAAANTDKFKKLSRRWTGQIGSGGVADGSVTTVPLASSTNLPTDTAVVAVIDRVDANGSATASLEETLIGVVSGTNLINCTRGVEGTAQAHNAGSVVEILVTAKGWNDLIDGLLVGHNQDGTHSSSIVTLSDTQTLTNKILTDSTNNVMAKSLKSATTTIDVSAATAPSSGQVLTATSSTAATWQSVGAGFNSGCSVYSSANLTLPASTVTKINFDTKVYDLNTEFNTSTNTFTATNAGKYLVTLSAYIVTLSDGKLLNLYIYKNGSEAYRNTYQSAGGPDLVASVSAIVSLAASDTITFYAMQNDTGSQTLAGANPNRTFAMIQRIF